MLFPTDSVLLLCSAAVLSLWTTSSLPASTAFAPTTARRHQRRLVPPCFVRRSKWDDILDDDDDDGTPKYTVKPDMKYEPRNVVRLHENFTAIRKAAGKDMITDVYTREPGSEVFWFTGKVARVSSVSVEQCVARQWNIIERHAGNMRPIDLFPSLGKLEIWTAPGDSEMKVAYNRPDLKFRKMKRDVPGADSVKNSMVGFQGEVYQAGEEGFRTWRTDEGLPARPQITVGGENRPPTKEELLQMRDDLKERGIDDPSLNEMAE